MTRPWRFRGNAAMKPELLPVTYDWAMVALSWLVCGIGEFTALSAFGRAGKTVRSIDSGSVAWGVVSLGGVGIWSMHFIGMIAWKVDLGVGYRLFETMVSLIAAVVVSSMALGYAARGGSITRLLVAGPLAGIGVTVMHYL